MIIELITINKQNQYNHFDVVLNEEGLNLRDDELADKFVHGDMDKINIDNFLELELGNGEIYGKIYVKDIDNSIESSDYFQLLERDIEELGDYLDDTVYEVLSKEEEKDREDKREYFTKDG